MLPFEHPFSEWMNIEQRRFGLEIGQHVLFAFVLDGSCRLGIAGMLRG